MQELKYSGEVNSERVAETAADLVILDGELDRIKALVHHAQIENIPVMLAHILQVRSHPTQLYDKAKYALADYKRSPVIQHHPPSPSHHGNTQPPAVQRQEASHQTRQPPFQHSTQDRANYPHQTQPPVTHGQQYSAGGGPPPPSHHGNTQPPAVQRQEASHQTRQPPFQHSTQDRANYPHQTQPPVTHGQQYSAGGGPPPVQHQHNTPPLTEVPPQDIPCLAAQGQQYTQFGHGNHPQQLQQPDYPNEYRRGSAPVVGLQQHPAEGVQGDQTRKSDGIYANLPLLAGLDVTDENNQSLDDPDYVTVRRISNVYETVVAPQETTREPFLPPDTFNFPEPIIRSQSKLERLNMVTADHSAVNSAQPSATSNPEFRKSSIPSSSMSRKKVDGGNPHTNPQGTHPVPTPQYSTQHKDSSHRFVSGSGSQENRMHSPGRNHRSDTPSANPPALNRAKGSAKSTQDSRSMTYPIVPPKNTPPDRPHTSPQTSLESHEYNQLSPPSQQSSHQSTHHGKGQEGRVCGGEHDEVSRMNRPDVSHSSFNSAKLSATSNPEIGRLSTRPSVSGDYENPRTNPQGTQPVPTPQYSTQSSDQLTGTSCSQPGGVGKGWLDIASHPLSQAGIPTASNVNLPTVDRAKPSIIVAKSSTGPTVSKHNTLPSPQSSVDTRTYDRLPDLAQLLAETAVSENRLNSSYGIIDIEGDTANEVGTLNL